MTILEKGLRLVAQHLAALRATTGEDLPAIGGLHALHEAVLLLAMDFLRLIRPEHCIPYLLVTGLSGLIDWG